MGIVTKGAVAIQFPVSSRGRPSWGCSYPSTPAGGRHHGQQQRRLIQHVCALKDAANGVKVNYDWQVR